MELSLDKKIEGILFWKSEPMSFSELAKIFTTGIEEIESAANTLKNRLENTGIKLIINGTEIAIVTNEEIGPIIEKLTKEEYDRDLSKASIETLSVIIYRGPIKKSQLDYIRGVNSQFILRNLLIRGLVEKIQDQKDERSFLYKASLDLLNYLGISNQKEMPDFESVNNDIESFINKTENGEK